MSAPCPIFGFTVRIELDPAADIDSTTLTRDLRGFLDAHGLVVSTGHRALEFIVTRDGSQATDSDRQLVRQWAGQRTDIAHIRISDLTDLS